MNIFFLDEDPHSAAAMLCDKHIGKMQLETAQMLSTACHVHKLAHPRLYKQTHTNHPSSVWARQSAANLRWLSAYVDGMDQEWLRRRRHGRPHASYYVSRIAISLLEDFGLQPGDKLTPIPLCMPERYWPAPELKFVTLPEVVQAYRRYYLAEKAAIATWSLGRTPSWWQPPV